MAKHPLKLGEITLDVIDRFSAGYTRTETGCFIWQRGVQKAKGHSYPKINIAGHPRLARSVAWVLAYGALPPKAGVSTSCGNELCVSPSHVIAFVSKTSTREAVLRAQTFIKNKHTKKGRTHSRLTPRYVKEREEWEDERLT